MDMKDENHMEGMKMEIENTQTMDNDFSDGLDETHQHLTIREGPSSSCRKVRVRSRPRLQWTKSFPPYSQCIGGLGEDKDWDNELNSESSIAYQDSLRHTDMIGEEGNEFDQGPEKKEDFELNARCAKDEVKSKWKTRRKDMSGGSNEVDTDGWERTKSRTRRAKETGREREHADREREGVTNSEWKHWGGKNSSFEVEGKEEDDEERKRSPILAAEGENEGSGESPEGKDEEAEELQRSQRDGSKTHQWSSPHPILSKLLHSSSSTSSCSSISLSSAESDEVFSEGEDAGSKRRTFKKVRMTQINTELMDFWHFFLSHSMHWHHVCASGCSVFQWKSLKLFFSTVLCTCGDLHGLERGL